MEQTWSSATFAGGMDISLHITLTVGLLIVAVAFATN